MRSAANAAGNGFARLMMAAWSAAETRTVEDVRVAGDCESGLAVVHLLAHAIGEGRELKDSGPGCPRRPCFGMWQGPTSRAAHKCI